MKTNIFLDIETIPDQDPDALKVIFENVTAPSRLSKQESIDKWLEENRETAAEEEWRKTSFNGGEGEIFCIRFAVESGEVDGFMREDLLKDSERNVLMAFNNRMQELEAESRSQVHFIGHYIGGFDIRFIFQRMAVHGIKPKFWLPYNDADWKNSFSDTNFIWSGARGSVKLANLCKYLGIPTPKEEMDGSEVWDYVREGKFEEVWNYCGADVEAVRGVWRKLNFLQPLERSQTEEHAKAV